MAREPFNRTWAESPDQFGEPTEPMWVSGWEGGADKEPPEAFAQNWWQQRADIALQQIERFGVMDWHVDAIYGIGGRARGNDGRFYLSVATPNQGNNPVSDTSGSWVRDAGPGQNIQIFSTAGAFTFTVPAVLRVGLRRAHVTLVGAGGAGGAALAGTTGRPGASGGWSLGLVDLAGVTSVSGSVGAGGQPVADGAGQSGGNTSFGAYMNATGGTGGLVGSGETAAAAGSGSGGDLNFIGNHGSNMAQASDEPMPGRPGPFGGAGAGQRAGAPVAGLRSGSAPGASGSGGATSGTGGAGANGIVIIQW